jgi:CubicO group peptidase (beta-lactamase class C family)
MKNWPRRLGGRCGIALLALAVVVALLPDATVAQRSGLPPKTSVAEQVETLVRTRLADPKGPASVSVTIVRGGETLVQQAWGTADAGSRRPATAAMTYRIGSISKQFTAALILKLVDRGQLALRDTLGRRLEPHFRDLPAEWRPITIEQLLNHTSGLQREYRDPIPYLQALVTRNGDPRLIAAARDPLLHAPGTRHLYSNAGYMILGVLVEKLYGRSHDDVLRTEIAVPLGLTTLGSCTAAEKRTTETMGHARSPKGELLPAAELLVDLALGSGGLCATAADLARWNMALHGGRVLSNSSYAAMTTPRGAAATDHYGFGIRSLRMSWGGRVLTHDGNTITFMSENSWFPAESLSVTVLCNTALGPGTSPMAAHLARIALGRTLSTTTRVAEGPERFVGFYEGRPGRGFTVTLEQGTLYVEPTDASRQKLVLQTETTYAAGDATFTFVVGVDGRATAAVFRAGTREQIFPKVK